MNDTQFRLLHDFLSQISTSLARLVTIQQQRLNLETLNATMTPDIINALVNWIKTLLAQLAAAPGNAAALATSQAALADLTAKDAGLNDPTLLANAQAIIAAAALADPPATPLPVPYDPTVTFLPGTLVVDSTGAIWTAVTPQVGEAPGVTPGNWTLTTPAATVAAATT